MAACISVFCSVVFRLVAEFADLKSRWHFSLALLYNDYEKMFDVNNSEFSYESSIDALEHVKYEAFCQGKGLFK